ncbi:MAG: basic amino acid ABC transporter substrate-binding protein [Clostridia bacterium]|nr:basic amino acid ABC transporter substrate-binding protein [Clostridia bacterium]
MKKIIAILAVMALVIACFAACGGKTEPKATNSDADTTAEIVENPAPTGDTLVMGTNAAFPPYEFVAEDGSYAGIDVEIATAVAEKLGKTVEVKDMEFDSLIPAVAGGSIDFVMAGLTVTDERKETVDFSDTYATGVQVIIVKEDSDIASADDLEGKKIGVQAGTTGDIYVTDDYGQENVSQFNNGSLAVQALVNGQVDCVVIDNEPAKNFVAANEGLKILATEYITEDYAAAFAKENTELHDQFNAALAELIADGTVQSIIDKYITAE